MNLDYQSFPSVLACDALDLPSKPGMYFVTKGNGDLLYVGISEDLRRRWRNHHRMREVACHKDAKIYWTNPRGIELKKAEEIAISVLKPPMNGTVGKPNHRANALGLDSFPHFIEQLKDLEQRYLSKFDSDHVRRLLDFKHDYQRWLSEICYEVIDEADTIGAASFALPSRYNEWLDLCGRSDVPSDILVFTLAGDDWPLQGLWAHEVGIKVQPMCRCIPVRPGEEVPFNVLQLRMYVGIDVYEADGIDIEAWMERL